MGLIKENKGLLIFISIMLLLMIIGWFLYAFFGYRFIKVIYEGRSIDFLNRIIEGQEIYPLEYYLKKGGQYFFIWNIHYLIILAGIISFWLFFIKGKVVFANRLFFLITSATILIAMFIISPGMYGDGPDYFMMTESLFNHLSPDLQYSDIQTLERCVKLKMRFDPENNLPASYFKAKDNRLYCFHFWAYPLFNLPVKFILHALHLNELKVFQITNSILLALALFHIVFISKMKELQKIFFSFLVVFCPAFWFIHWTHSEIFSYSFIIMSLVYMHMRKWRASILCAAIGATQNQTLIFMVVFLWAKGILLSKQKWKDLFILSFLASPAITPNIFYYVKYGVPNLLLAKTASGFNNITISGIHEMFFDLNIGMLPYIPITLFIFLGILVRDIFLKRKISINLQLFLLMIIIMLLCTLTCSWNHGTSGPSRYVILMLPLVFCIVVAEISQSLQKLNMPLYLSTIIIQVFIVLYGGGLIPRIDYVYHTPLARFVLNHFPAIYSPSYEIFIERTLHREGWSDTPVVYYYKGKYRKALVKGKDKNQLIYIPEKYVGLFNDKDNEEKMFYINY